MKLSVIWIGPNQRTKQSEYLSKVLITLVNISLSLNETVAGLKLWIMEYGSL